MTAIVGSEIKVKRSVAAAAGNTTAQADPNASLGDQVSTTEWTGGSANDLYDDISGAENAASTSDYRGLFVHNTNGANALQNTKLWISAEVAGGASISIGADTTAASVVTSGSAQMLTIANETTAPAGVTFTAPTTQAGGVDLGNIPVNNVKGFWVKRSAANTSALSNDGVTLAVGGDTGSL